MELNTNKNDNRKYKIKTIQNIAVYTKESKLGYLLRFYYLIS